MYVLKKNIILLNTVITILIIEYLLHFRAFDQSFMV